MLLDRLLLLLLLLVKLALVLVLVLLLVTDAIVWSGVRQAITLVRCGSGCRLGCMVMLEVLLLIGSKPVLVVLWLQVRSDSHLVLLSLLFILFLRCLVI